MGNATGGNMSETNNSTGFIPWFFVLETYRLHLKLWRKVDLRLQAMKKDDLTRRIGVWCVRLHLPVRVMHVCIRLLPESLPFRLELDISEVELQETQHVWKHCRLNCRLL
jgi:hypothetical protein